MAPLTNCDQCYKATPHTHKHVPGKCICEDDLYSNEFRPFFLLIKKEEEKEDKWAKICVEVKRTAIPDPINPFTKKSICTQTYPTCLIPAAPRNACCFYCGNDN